MSAVNERHRIHAETLFDRVLVGVDGCEAGLEAARQAFVLSEGALTLLAAYDVAPGIVGGTGVGVPSYFDDDAQRYRAEAIVRGVRESLGDTTLAAKVARGPAWDALIREANEMESTLIAVGSHGVARLAGIILGSVATELVHNAPRSVLIARAAQHETPQRIVVGIDGSPQSADAYAVATHLSERFGAEVWPVVAHGGKPVDRALVDRIVERREELLDDPVPALVAAAADADLVVVGSRGLHGLRALGSVSERVAHQARSSVLVVR